jgi:hypothetical protein
MMEGNMNIYEKLLNIQHELKAPKNCRNTFGNYNYRSAEGILEALKPLCFKYKAVLRMTDEIVDIGGKLFVKAVGELIDVEVSNPTPDSIFAIGAQGWAQIPDGKKGMDLAQVTGAASSYARKYCLNALFAIDDTKDSDALPPDEPKHEETKGTENWRLIDGNVVLIKGQDGKFYELTRLTKRQLEVALKNPLYEGIKPFIEVELQKK